MYMLYEFFEEKGFDIEVEDLDLDFKREFLTQLTPNQKEEQISKVKEKTQIRLKDTLVSPKPIKNK